MKKLLTTFATVIALSGGSVYAAETVSVAASPVPHAEILEVAKPLLAKEGIDLQIKVFTDYVQPNVQVSGKRLDANFFQNQPYLDNYNKAKGTNLVNVGAVHIEPIGLYSSKFKSLDELKEGATFSIPNDVTNGSRALFLLQKNGLIKLKEGLTENVTLKDIVENPKKIKFRELEAAFLPRVFDQVDFAVINTNYALEANLNPARDAVVVEDRESPYANIVVVLEENKDKEAIKKLVKALQSPEVKKFIDEKYQGGIFAVFD